MAILATFYDHMKDISRQENMSLCEAMQEAASLGIQRLEISGNNLLGREDEVGQELAFCGLGISSIPSYFDFGRDTDVKKQSLPILEAAKYLHADKLLVIPGFFEETDGKEAREAQTLRMEDCINELSDLAAKYGVSLVMEDYDSPLAPYATMEGLRRFMDRCPGLFCAYDTGNFRYMAQDELEALELLKDKIAHVHLKDRSYVGSNQEPEKKAVDGVSIYPCPVGHGNLHIDEAIQRLRQIGYDGVYTLEHYDSNATLDYLRKSVAFVKERI